MITQLPIITYKGISYFFDYRLNQLREVKTAKFIFLNNQELELLSYAIENKNSRLIKLNMDDLRWKL